MHNAIVYKNLVALLKFVPLSIFANWNKYECWQICFRSDVGVSAKTLLRTIGNQTQRPHSWDVAILLESYAGHNVWTTYWMP